MTRYPAVIDHLLILVVSLFRKNRCLGVIVALSAPEFRCTAPAERRGPGEEFRSTLRSLEGAIGPTTELVFVYIGIDIPHLGEIPS